MNEMMKVLSTAAALALPLAASPLTAQHPMVAAHAGERTITVSAFGSVRQAPDQAVLMLAVESVGETARGASQENAQKMEALIEAVVARGIPRDKIQTISYQLHPEYAHSREQVEAPRITGYRASNMVQVRIDSIPRAGTIIDAAVSVGANRIHGLSYEISDTDAARLTALREAVANARAEAEAIAQALGERLGPAISVMSGGGQGPPQPMYRGVEMMAMGGDAATPVEPGTMELTAHVTVVYPLRPE